MPAIIAYDVNPDLNQLWQSNKHKVIDVLKLATPLSPRVHHSNR